MDSQKEQTINHRFEENNLTEAINSTEQKSKKTVKRAYKKLSSKCNILKETCEVTKSM